MCVPHVVHTLNRIGGRPVAWPCLAETRRVADLPAQGAPGMLLERSPPRQAPQGAAKPTQGCATPGGSAGPVLCPSCRARPQVLPSPGGRGRAPNHAAPFSAGSRESARGRRRPSLLCAPAGGVAAAAPCHESSGSLKSAAPCALPAKGFSPRIAALRSGRNTGPASPTRTGPTRKREVQPFEEDRAGMAIPRPAASPFLRAALLPFVGVPDTRPASWPGAVAVGRPTRRPPGLARDFRMFTTSAGRRLPLRGPLMGRAALLAVRVHSVAW